MEKLKMAIVFFLDSSQSRGNNNLEGQENPDGGKETSLSINRD